ncbi:hypothetical protein VNO77_31999 [Canavalia gladiata]|uniref:Exocyst subunit Exo70 family protein n=1 Tax=Canavalia gladiata TaxID=3824 RepID=A0AAN9KPE9_CANGL
MKLILYRILRWLKQPRVWRFVCFASSVIGLLCYALSSTFNHLFGKWSWWKIILYIVFGFIICLAVLFAKAWQHSTSLRLEAHLAFLVLIITCIYSFFFDKVANGKPDAYGLISCAAFAIMSLGLSRLTQCGFEIDLLYFFCGGLILQLMKIKLWLVVVGGSFSYSLILLRSSLDTPREHLQLQDQNQVTIQVDSDSEEVNHGNDHHIMSENHDVRIQDGGVTQVNSHSQKDSSDSDLLWLNFMDCIKALEKENQKLIHMVSNHVDEYLIAEAQLDRDVNLVMDAFPSGILTRLHKIMKLMMEAGFEEECCHVYSSCRREFLEQCLSTLGLQELNAEDVAKSTKVCELVVKILFPSERKLCDFVFSGFSFAADISFVKVSMELTICLLSFANAIVTTGSYLPNLLVSIVPKLSESLYELILEFESLCCGKYSASLINDAHRVRNRLGIFMDLANIIYSDKVEESVPGGGIHSITRQVMKYIRNIYITDDYDTWQAVQEYTSIVPMSEGKSSFSVQIAKMIELLESNLEAKSGNYTYPALGYVFMMNNLSYIRQEAYRLGTILDDDWFRIYTEKVAQNLQFYERTSWDKMLNFLKLESNESVVPNIVAESMKDKLNLFNLHFEEICNVQSTWNVPDKQLRERAIISIENILLPAYGNFTGKFLDVLGNHANEYIEYGMLEIQDRLNHLFLVSE